MGLPGGITKDTSARKNANKSAIPLAPHDAALQAYMQSFVQSIEQKFALDWHRRKAEHELDVDALHAHFRLHFEKALAELEKKYSIDQEQVAAERDVKVLDLKADFAYDALAAIARHQAAASPSKNRTSGKKSDPITIAEAVSQSANVDGALARASASFIKQEHAADIQLTKFCHTSLTNTSSAVSDDQHSVKPEMADRRKERSNPPERAEPMISTAGCRNTAADAPTCSQTEHWWDKYPVRPMSKPQLVALSTKLVSLSKSHRITSDEAKHSTALSTLEQDLKKGQYVSLRDFAKALSRSLTITAWDEGHDPERKKVADDLIAGIEPALEGVKAMEEATEHDESQVACGKENKERFGTIVGEAEAEVRTTVDLTGLED